MINITNKTNIRSTTNTQYTVLDDINSIKSSASLQRISRKPLQRSTSRISPCRDSSQNTLKGINFKKLFVKRNSLKEVKERQQHSQRNGIIHRKEQNRTERKRCPTPIPGISRRRLDDKKNNNPERQRELQLENDIFIAELQKNYYDEKEKREKLEKQVSNLGNQLKVTDNRIEELEKQLKQSQLRQKEEQLKISELHYLVDKKENNLYEARSNLEKMKKQIKESRINELSLQNTKIRKENSEVKHQLQVIEGENQLLYSKCQLLDDQVYELKKINSTLSEKQYIASKLRYIDDLNEIVSLSKNQREEFLQKIIHQKEQELLKHKSIIDKLQIKINFMNRKNNQTIEELKAKKVMDLKSLRNTLSCIVKQNHNLKKEAERLKKKINLAALQQTSAMARDNRHIDDDDRISLNLSPDHSDT